MYDVEHLVREHKLQMAALSREQRQNAARRRRQIEDNDREIERLLRLHTARTFEQPRKVPFWPQIKWMMNILL